MKNNLLSEINRFREIVGLKLINEAPTGVSPIYEAIERFWTKFGTRGVSKVELEALEAAISTEATLVKEFDEIGTKLKNPSTMAQGETQLDTYFTNLPKFQRLINVIERAAPDELNSVLDKTIKSKLGRAYDDYLEAYELDGTNGMLNMYRATTPTISNKVEYMLEKWKPEPKVKGGGGTSGGGGGTSGRGGTNNSSDWDWLNKPVQTGEAKTTEEILDKMRKELGTEFAIYENMVDKLSQLTQEEKELVKLAFSEGRQYLSQPDKLLDMGKRLRLSKYKGLKRLGLWILQNPTLALKRTGGLVALGVGGYGLYVLGKIGSRAINNVDNTVDKKMDEWEGKKPEETKPEETKPEEDNEKIFDPNNPNP